MFIRFYTSWEQVGGIFSNKQLHFNDLFVAKIRGNVWYVGPDVSQRCLL